CTSTISPAAKPVVHVVALPPGLPAAFARNEVPDVWLASSHPANDSAELSGRYCCWSFHRIASTPHVRKRADASAIQPAFRVESFGSSTEPTSPISSDLPSACA